MRTRRPLAGLAAGLVALALTGCGQTGAPAASGSAGGSTGPTSDVTVVTTTTMLGDLAGQITDCAGGKTTTLMPPGVDPHEFSMSSQQATGLVKATLVVINGLELEHGIEPVLDSAKADGATILSIADKVDPIPFTEPEGHDEHGHEGETAAPTAAASGSESPAAEEHAHEHGEGDPHFWLDAQRGARAATVIGDKLAEKTGNATYTECGKQVSDKMMAVDKEITDTLAKVPADKRVLITDHEAFGYFAKRYNFRIAGVVVPGGSTDAQPSSEQVAELVETIKKEKVRAIFSNTNVNQKLVQAVATEVGGDVKVVPLHVESVDKTDGVNTYADQLKVNAKLIADALAQG